MKTFAKVISILILALASLSHPLNATEALPDKTHILFLADSHGVGPFGEGMDETLRMLPGVSVDTYAIGASQPESFIKGFTTTCGYVGHADNKTPPQKRSCKKIKAPLIKNVAKGQITVVALGTNQLWDSRGWDFAKASIEKMIAVIQQSGARCIWIGPPKMRRFKLEDQARLYDVLSTAVRGDTRYPPCELIDSRLYTQYPAKGGDGIHYAWDKTMDKLGRAWGLDAGKVATSMIERF